MKKIYLGLFVLVFMLSACSISIGDTKDEKEKTEKNTTEAQKEDNKSENEEKTKDKKDDTQSSSKETKEKASSEYKDNSVYGQLTLTDHEVEGAYFDKNTRTKYILDQNKNIIKIVDKSNDNSSLKKYMQDDAQKEEEFSNGVYKYYSKSIDKSYKVINKNNVMIVTKY